MIAVTSPARATPSGSLLQMCRLYIGASIHVAPGTTSTASVETVVC